MYCSSKFGAVDTLFSASLTIRLLWIWKEHSIHGPKMQLTKTLLGSSGGFFCFSTSVCRTIMMGHKLQDKIGDI